jgi:hypothetical protein
LETELLAKKVGSWRGGTPQYELCCTLRTWWFF